MNLTPPVISLRTNNNCVLLHDLLIKWEYNWILPRYQRIYVWREDNIKKLLNSIKKNCDNTLWMGALLFALAPEKNSNCLQIFDGQQRILTFVSIWCVLQEKQIDLRLTSPWKDFWDGVRNPKKDTINFSDIIYYCKNTHSDNDSLKKIISVIVNFKKTENNLLPKINSCLEKQLYVTTLQIKSGKIYDYFEHVNSTNVVLTLTEKCLAFIAEEYEEESRKNWNILQRWLSYPTKKEKDILVEYFIKIFNDKGIEKGLDPFDVFKQLDKQIICNSFFKFLNIYEKQREEKNSTRGQTFYKYYLYKIAWKNYWPIIVILKFKQFNNIFKYLLNNLWKIDLWTYCLGETGQQSSDTLPVVKKILQKDDQDQAKERLWDFLKNKRIKLVTSVESLCFLKNSLLSIRYHIKNTERLKIFFWLLLSGKSPLDLKKKMEGKSWIKTFIDNKWEVEHIIAKEAHENIPVRDKNELKNLMLVSGPLNRRMSNKPVNKKILDYKNDSQYIFQHQLYKWIKYTNIDNIHNQIWDSNLEIYKKKFDQNLKNIWKLKTLI